MNKLLFLLFFSSSVVLFGCARKAISEEDISIIPKPAMLEPGVGFFELKQSTLVNFGEFDDLNKQFLQDINEETGFRLSASSDAVHGIRLHKMDGLADEEYRLKVARDEIAIQATSSAGAYYALQTIRQLIHQDKKKGDSFLIPAVEISDKPAFPWRGYMLDVSRHFFEVDDIKKVLDFMAELKFNRFHWHLTDDQGWRIEIKKYPRLTEIGAWRVDYNNTDENVSNWWGRPVQKEGEEATYGGYYTQEEIKEIVSYAKARHIEIVPEIDVPGHSQAILASYPEVSCEPSKKFYVATGGAYKDNALCPSTPFTYTFLEDVFEEVTTLFPFDYIHVGGDECNKSGWQNHKQCQNFIKEKGLKDEHGLQSYFIKQVEKILNANGKKLIGWDEILEGGLAPNATVMSWRGETGGITAARAGHQVIMTPNYANYLDLKQGQSDHEPNLGYSEALLSASYNYSVIPEELNPEEAKLIMGTQGNLWTESISDWSKLTYMTFPRLFAVAENGWTAESNQNFDDFISRLKPRLEKLDNRGVRYAKSVFNPWIHQEGNGETIQISLDSELSDPEIRFTLDGSNPTEKSSIYRSPITISQTTTIKTAIFKDGKRLGNIKSATYPVHKAAGAKVNYLKPYSESDKANKEKALTDLNYGELDVQGDMNWQGFPDGMEVEIVFDQPTDVQLVEVNSMRLTINGIYPPSKIRVLGSTDGRNFSEIGTSGTIEENLVQGRNRITNRVICPAKGLKKLRVEADVLSPIPDGHHKAGNKAYLKIDEIVVL